MPEELTKRIAIGAQTTAAAVVVALPRADGPTSDVELRAENGASTPISPQDATRVASQHHEVEFENEWVRIVRVKLPAGMRTQSHVHSLPAVTVVLSDTQIRVVDDDGQTRDGDRNEGGVRWMDPSGRHTVENVGKSELLAIRAEIKQAPARP